MAVERTVKIAIEGEDKVSGVLEKVKGELGTFEKVNKTTTQAITGYWSKMTLAIGSIVGALYTVKKGFDLISDTAAFYEQKAALEALAKQYGLTADAVINFVKIGTSGLVSLKEATDIATQALRLNIPPEYLEKLSRAAEGLSDELKIGVREAFEMITATTIRAREASFRQFGIIVDLNKVYEEYAKQINKTAKELTEQEKHTARLIFFVDELNKRFPETNRELESLNDRLTRMRTTYEDAKLAIGETLIRFKFFFLGIFEALVATGAKIYEIITGALALSEKFLGLFGIKGKFWQEEYGKAVNITNISLQNMVEYLKLAFAPTEDLRKVIAGTTPVLRNIGVVSDDVTNKKVENAKKIANINKKLSDEINALTLNETEYKKRKILEAYEYYKGIIGETAKLEQWKNLKLAELDKETAQKTADVNKKLLDEINTLTLSETEYKKLKILEAYEHYKSIIGETVELEQWKNLKLAELDKKTAEERKRIAKKYYEEYKSIAFSALRELTTTIPPEYAEYAQGIETALSRIFEINEQINEQIIKNEEITAQQRMALASSTTQFIGNTLLMLAKYADESGEMVFAMQKAYAIAMAIINTAQGITAALKLGPWGIPLAAVIGAMGAIQIATIAAASPTKTATAPSVPTTGAIATAERPTPAYTPPAKPQSQVVNVYVYGHIIDEDKFAREILPSIRKAIRDGK